MSDAELKKRLEEAGRRLGAREAEHASALEAARERAESLRERVASAIDAFHAAASQSGAPQLRVEVSRARPDAKHLRSVEFDLQRGRHRAVVTVKSRGEVTLVGPFRSGKEEGPCRSFPMDAEPEISAALGDFLERFLDQAATP
jgi:hypothetical protein